MIIEIPRRGQPIEVRFRAFERLISGVTFNWKWMDGETALFSLDENFDGAIKIVSSGRIPVEEILTIMAPEDLKVMLEASIGRLGGFSSHDTQSLTKLIDGFSWGMATRPLGTTWGAIHTRCAREGM